MSLLKHRVKRANRKIKPNDSTPAETKTDETKQTSTEQKVSDFDTAFKKIMDALVLAASVPIRILTYLLNPPGSALLFALGAIYFLLVNIEGYHQALPGPDLAFLPKPFVEDDSNWLNFFLVIIDPSFYVVAVVSLVVQAIQTWSLRENTVEEQRREYVSVSHYRVPDEHPNQIDLAKHRRQAFKRAGMKTVNKMGLVVLLAYLIDFGIAISNYPILGLGDPGQTWTNFCWFVLSVFGAELFLTMFLMAIRDLLPPEKRKDDRVRMN